MIDDLDTLLTGNRIFKQRNVDIGIVSLEDAWAWGFSGVMVRGSGAAWDLRKSQPYERYNEFEFEIPVGKNCDNYDRYLIRMLEMRDSVKIMKQCVEKLLSAEGRGPEFLRQQQDGSPKTERNETLHGSAHSTLQTLYRRVQKYPKVKSIRRWRHQRVNLEFMLFPMALTNPTVAKCVRRDLPICRPWILCARATCWPMWAPFLVPWISFLVRSIANVSSSFSRRYSSTQRVCV